ncbi:MAG: hypothetical protein WC501_04640 [Candidatus Micrarchaeia archaeon]
MKLGKKNLTKTETKSFFKKACLLGGGILAGTALIFMGIMAKDIDIKINDLRDQERIKSTMSCKPTLGTIAYVDGNCMTVKENSARPIAKKGKHFVTFSFPLYHSKAEPLIGVYELDEKKRAETGYVPLGPGIGFLSEKVNDSAVKGGERVIIHSKEGEIARVEFPYRIRPEQISEIPEKPWWGVQKETHLMAVENGDVKPEGFGETGFGATEVVLGKKNPSATLPNKIIIVLTSVTKERIKEETNYSVKGYLKDWWEREHHFKIETGKKQAVIEAHMRTDISYTVNLDNPEEIALFPERPVKLTVYASIMENNKSNNVVPEAIYGGIGHERSL